MSAQAKVCPVVQRGAQVLAFEHPNAGRQFVKGGIRPGESPRAAAQRELFEESGLQIGSGWRALGQARIDGLVWHFLAAQAVAQAVAPDGWTHQTLDDHGHVFRFFWHPLDRPLDPDWHPIFHKAAAFFVPRLTAFRA